MIAIKVPPLGESTPEATLSRWMKQPGDAVAAGETVVELETDKVTVEVPAIRAGVVVSHSHKEGDIVKVDEVLGEMDDEAIPATVAAAPAAAATAATAAAPAVAVPAALGSATLGASQVRAAPSAQKLAAERGVDLATVKGTGRGGVVSKPDVIEQTKKTPPPPPKPVAPVANGARETREKMSTRRKRIAENLLLSQQSTAHLTTFNEVDMSALASLRDRLRDKVEKEHGVRLTYMPFFAKAACLALKQYPVVNAQIDEDSVVYHHYVHMGIAVASDQGLVVPVVKDADAKGILDISREISQVATRAKDGKLTLDDLSGGTFTITNGGVFGSLVSTPILNYPQSGILGLHKIQDRPIALNGQVVIRPMMYIALSYDHRLVDGQQAVLFLVRIKELIEDPASMLID
ncbi:MAG TPA: 2-oxoglutarate dehydrogenase complex dihydrolipoyllysine-residue succinyltransferase [Gemmatimonadaceae bacterium]|nr:2-oxoglutarate dehydrogenase complex dihydrolipoyllysine-residue succinyltransferase [Gemmatimonadaceae bacterium]